MNIYRFVTQSQHVEPREVIKLSDARALGFHDLRRIRCQDLYFIEGQLSRETCRQLALELLADPVTQTVYWEELPAPSPALDPGSIAIEISFRPGVTDSVAEQIVRASQELGLREIRRAATGMRYIVEGLDASAAEQLAARLLANDIIQQWRVGPIDPSFPHEVGASQAVKILPIRQQGDEQLTSLSNDRRAALDLAELKAIQTYFGAEERDPTDVEFETIAQTWSEHCLHKTFKARVDVQGNGNCYQIDSLLKTCLKAATEEIRAPWVRSAFEDNAGIIDFDDEFEVSFKVETHNHPSAIEPFGGANTGVGGVIRDVLGVSAKPIAATDVLCFGPQSADPGRLPANVLHPRRIQSGVVAGIGDYGNKIGIPTVNGAILYDEGYTANPLVFCGSVGLAPKGRHVRSPQQGDRVIVLGGRTGRDGLRGATFSSLTLDAHTGDVAGASVQIGDPITEKGIIDVVTRARDLALYHAITDCGAGGLSSAVGEMASSIGAEVELANVKLKYPGLAPWEVWLSEAQERMVLAVPPEALAALQGLCDTFDTELTDIGQFTGFGRLVVKNTGKVVLDLANDFLHHGIPQRQLRATINQPREPAIGARVPEADIEETLLRLLSHPNIASNAAVIRSYDHEIQGGTVVKPLTGLEADAPSDAAVLKPIGTGGTTGIVLSNGINPEYGKQDPYRMAQAAIDEAIRNAVSVGADPERIAILDNFCWGDPRQAETMGALVEAARGCLDAALLFRTPFISGKDSLNNEFVDASGQRHSIPPTLLISAIGLIEDVNRAVTMDLKSVGNEIYLIGSFRPVFGGSHFSKISACNIQEPVPDVHKITPEVYKALHRAILSKSVCSVHDLSEGGLAVAAAEMCIGGRLGMKLEIRGWADGLRTLFGESTGALLVEVRPPDKTKFLSSFEGLPVQWMGTVTQEAALSFIIQGSSILEIPLPSLIAAWNSHA